MCVCVFVGLNIYSFILSQVRLPNGWQTANRSRRSRVGRLRSRWHDTAPQLDVTTATNDTPSSVQFPASPKLWFCTTWGKRTNEMLHFYPRQYYYFIKMKHISSRLLSLWLTVHPIISVSTVYSENVRNVNPLREHRHGDAFSIRC